MVAVRLSQGFRLAAAVLCLGVIAADVAANGTPPRVLVIHSFGRDMEPYGAIESAFRTALVRGAERPIAIHEATLDAAQPDSLVSDDLFIAHLLDRFRAGEPDLVVTFGPPAGRFYAAHRQRLFPSKPFVMAALENRTAPIAALGPGDAAVTSVIEFPALVENARRLLPALRTLFVISGDSPLERFWVEQMRRDFAPLEGQVRFEYLVGMTLEQMRERVATLPPNSAILYVSLRVDAAGVPYARQTALSVLNDATNAPIFGVYETEIGNGVVGGPYQSQRRRGEFAAQASLRALRGERSDVPSIVRTGFEPPVYDWRELSRWNIDAARLPPDAEVRFRPRSLWDDHRGEFFVIVAALLLELALIGGLLLERGRARRAERAALGLGGQLITAHEDERRRIARELHDDVTQRLARLSIDAAVIEQAASIRAKDDATHALREELMRLSEDVHALSHQLHPAILEDLGLAEALKAEGDRMARREVISCRVDAAGVPVGISRDVALCLFRVAQEALNNVVRHAKASSVDVELASKGSGLQLRIRDNGRGFDPANGHEHPSLGLASMRERVRLLHGKLDVDSRPGGGTTVLAWVPLGATA